MSRFKNIAFHSILQVISQTKRPKNTQEAVIVQIVDSKSPKRSWCSRPSSSSQPITWRTCWLKAKGAKNLKFRKGSLVSDLKVWKRVEKILNCGFFTKFQLNKHEPSHSSGSKAASLDKCKCKPLTKEAHCQEVPNKRGAKPEALTRGAPASVGHVIHPCLVY